MRKPIKLDPPRPYFTDSGTRGPRWLPLAVIVSELYETGWHCKQITIRCPFCGKLHGGHGWPLTDPPLDQDRERCPHCPVAGLEAEYALVRPEEAERLYEEARQGGRAT